MLKISNHYGFNSIVRSNLAPISGSPYLYLPGDGLGSIMYTGDQAIPSVTDTMSICIKLVPDGGWSGYYGSIATLVSKWNTSNGTFIFFLTSGYMNFRSSNNGTAINSKNSIDLTYAASPPTGTTPYWLGVTCSHILTGDISFYTSVDGTTWSKLGSSYTLTYGGLIYNPSNTPLRLGSYISPTGGNTFGGKIYRMKIISGIDATFSSTPVVDFDPSLYVSGTSFTASTGEVWTLAGNAAILTV